MNEIEESVIEDKDDRQDRRGFFKHIAKYLIGFTAFGIAYTFGLKRRGEFSLGKMKNAEFGLPEAQGTCGSSYNCAGGGGECGSSYECAGGGGKCGSSYECAGGGRKPSGGGACGSSYNCAGGGGSCGSSYECAGGGGKCGSSYNCAGQ